MVYLCEGLVMTLEMKPASGGSTNTRTFMSIKNKIKQIYETITALSSSISVDS